MRATLRVCMLLGYAAADSSVRCRRLKRTLDCVAIPIHLGTCAFTASGWSGVFYPKRMKSAEYLAYYSQRFETVEVDSTFYGCPQQKTVENWYQKTQPGFIGVDGDGVKTPILWAW